jgi:hypothetical protein
MGPDRLTRVEGMRKHEKHRTNTNKTQVGYEIVVVLLSIIALLDETVRNTENFEFSSVLVYMGPVWGMVEKHEIHKTKQTGNHE